MRRLLTISILCLSLFIGPTIALAQEGSVGVVDVRYILNNSKAAKHIEAQRQSLREKFLTEISKTEQGLRAEEKVLLEQRAKLSQEDYLQKRQAYEAKLLEIRKQTQKKKRKVEEASNAALDALREQLYVVVQSIANDRGFELVISNQNVIAGAKSLDITEETMKRLNAELEEIPLDMGEDQMADPQFFQKSQSFTLADIAKIAGAELAAGVDGDYIVEDIAALDQAGPSDLSFLDNVKYRDALKTSKAGACFIHPEQAGLAPDGLHILLTPQPYKAYALAAQAFYPQAKPAASISEHAYIDKSAKIGDGCTIEPGVVIAAGVEIGDNTWIEANVTINQNVEIGADCRIGAGATLSHCIIKDHTRLYPGVRVGQDGFGFAIDPKGHVKVPQLGRVIIEDHVEIGANTTIDRGAGPDTVIGQGTWIDNLVQIGHNVQIGRGCIIVSQAGVAGSTVIEDFVAIGGQAGIAGHLTVGTGARIAGQSGVMRDIPVGEEHMGSPAMPIKQYMKQVAFLKRLIKKEK